MLTMVTPDRALPWCIRGVSVAITSMSVYDVSEFARRRVLIICTEFNEVHRKELTKNRSTEHASPTEVL